MTTVTVGRDGYVKMWGDGKICLFSLKFPLLTKHVWNMRDIEQIRN